MWVNWSCKRSKSIAANLEGKVLCPSAKTGPRSGTTAMKHEADKARVLAMIMCQINECMAKMPKVVHGTQCVDTCSLKKGIQKFGVKGDRLLSKNEAAT